VKLYVFPIAPNPTRPRLHIAEKHEGGADFKLEEVTVNFREQDQKSADPIRRNRLGPCYEGVARWDAKFRERASARQVLLL
jgi:hypothetical protein